MEQIEWRIIIDTNELYSVSNTGLVRNNKTNKLLKPELHYKGYLRVNINKKHKAIHRLVAIAFIINVNNKPQINHIDGNKQNNNINNLEWCTATENNRHAINKGLRKVKPKTIKPIKEKTIKNYSNYKPPKQNKLSEKEVKQIKYLNTKLSCQDIANLYNVHFSTIWDIRNNRTWKDI